MVKKGDRFFDGFGGLAIARAQSCNRRSPLKLSQEVSDRVWEKGRSPQLLIAESLAHRETDLEKPKGASSRPTRSACRYCYCRRLIAHQHFFLFKYFLTHAEYDKRCDPASAKDARERAPRQENGKMTPTSLETYDPQAYAALLSRVLPAAITDDEQNVRTIEIAEELSHKERTPEEERLLNLLLVLIERYESEVATEMESNSSPLDVLKFLVEENHLKQSDLVPIFGSSGTTSEIFSGKRRISKNAAIKLGEKFGLDYTLFL